MVRSVFLILRKMDLVSQPSVLVCLFIGQLEPLVLKVISM